MGQKCRTVNAHAKLRATERYGIEACPRIVNGILSKIRNGKAKLVEYMRNSHRMVFSVRYSGKRYAVVVPPTKDHIITFLPSSVWKSAVGKRKKYTL